MSKSLELCIDTSTRYASVAISSYGTILVNLSWHSQLNHSVELVPAIQDILRRTGIKISDLSAVFVARGPGGFSALRVGISFAKSLASARSLPIVSVPTLDIESQPFMNLERPVCAVIQAGKEKIYSGLYHPKRATTESCDLEYKVFKPNELIDSLPDKTLICGEAANTIGMLICSKSLIVVDSGPPTRNGVALGRLGYERLKEGNIDDAIKLEPIYLHGSQIKSASRNR